MPTFTRTNLKQDIIRTYAGIANIDRLVNRAVMDVISEIDLRSTKRRSYLSPYLSTGDYDYQAPSDLKEWAVIDIRRVAGRSLVDKFDMVQSEYFDRHKYLHKNLVAIEDNSFLKKLRISAELRGGSEQATIDSCESLTANGTWAATPDASGLFLDKDTYITGEAAIGFDMDVGGTTTTAGIITNPAIPTALDLSDYVRGSVFIWVYIPTVTSLGSFTLRVGSSSSNYYSRQVTVTNENLAFTVGWNLLRFDIDGATQTGTVNLAAISYVRLAVNRSGGGSLNGSSHWRVDNIIISRGLQHEVWYYTKYGWQTSAGSYIEQSTADTDLINCDTEEYDLFVLRGKEIVAKDQKEFTDAILYGQDYQLKKADYLSKYPSERLLVIQRYYDLGSDMNESWLI